MLLCLVRGLTAPDRPSVDSPPPDSEYSCCVWTCFLAAFVGGFCFGFACFLFLVPALLLSEVMDEGGGAMPAATFRA